MTCHNDTQLIHGGWEIVLYRQVTPSGILTDCSGVLMQRTGYPCSDSTTKLLPLLAQRVGFEIPKWHTHIPLYTKPHQNKDI